MTITEREDALFERWRARRPRLVRDGLVDEAAYLASSPRVALVLKDVNDEGGGGWDLREVLRDGPRWQTWNTVARWSRGLRALDRDLPWAEVGPKPTADERREAARPLCVVNLKKEPGGAASVRSDVARYAREDADLLGEQLALYGPDVTVCCGVGADFATAAGIEAWRRTTRGVRYAEVDGGLAVDYYHPQARYPADMLYYTLIDAVRELWRPG